MYIGKNPERNMADVSITPFLLYNQNVTTNTV